MQKFRLYDDVGTIKEGTLKQCLNLLEKWVDGKDVKEFEGADVNVLYNDYDISREKLAIETALETGEFYSVMGFSLDEIEE